MTDIPAALCVSASGPNERIVPWIALGVACSGSTRIVLCNVEGEPALRRGATVKTEAMRTTINGQTAFGILFADDLELPRAGSLDTTLYPSGPGVRLLEGSQGSYPLQHNHNLGLWKDGL